MACNLATNKKEGKQLLLHANKQNNNKCFLKSHFQRHVFLSEKRKM